MVGGRADASRPRGLAPLPRQRVHDAIAFARRSRVYKRRLQRLRGRRTLSSNGTRVPACDCLHFVSRR